MTICLDQSFLFGLPKENGTRAEGEWALPLSALLRFFVNRRLRENWERVRGDQARFLKQTCIAFCNFPCSGIIFTVFA